MARGTGSSRLNGADKAVPPEPLSLGVRRVVRIRLQRLGRTHRPFYRINAIDIRTRRNGRVIENLGWYDPMAKGQQVELKTERIKEWLDKGAQPSDTVRDMLAKAELLSDAAMKEWEAQREVDRRRVSCKQALKTCEAAAAEIEKLAESAEGDLTSFLNTAKRSINEAKNTISHAVIERAEAAAESASKALTDAKAEAAKAAPPAEEEPAAEGDAEAASE
jgi:small subunit ribosomal protein S16